MLQWRKENAFSDRLSNFLVIVKVLSAIVIKIYIIWHMQIDIGTRKMRNIID